jgi:hypothetical protein
MSGAAPRRKVAEEIAEIASAQASSRASTWRGLDQGRFQSEGPDTESDWKKRLSKRQARATTERFPSRCSLTVQRISENLSLSNWPVSCMAAKSPLLLPEYYVLRREMAGRSGSRPNWNELKPSGTRVADLTRATPRDLAAAEAL